MKHWLRNNIRSLPYLLMFPLIFLVADLVLLFQGVDADEVFGLFSVLVYVEFIFIPWFALNLVYIFNRYLHGIPLWKQITFRVGIAVIGVLVATGTMEFIYHMNGLIDDDIITLGNINVDPVATNFITNGFVGLFIAIPVYFSQARHYEMNIKLKDHAYEIQKLEKLEAQSRLDALQSKLNPHFLHNSLNTLAGLVYEDPAKAEQVVVGLSRLFRYSLNRANAHFVPLTEEIEMVRTYLAIEKIRFDDSLEYYIEMDDEALSVQVPRFLLQPLAENAVKHGTSKIEQGIIGVQIKVTGNSVVIMIRDNGPPFEDNPLPGFGLHSTAEKLKLLYPGRHAMHLTNDPYKHIFIQLTSEKTNLEYDRPYSNHH